MINNFRQKNNEYQQNKDEIVTEIDCLHNEFSSSSLKDGNCNCVWIEDQDLAEQACGGCEHNVRLYRDDLIHWRGKHRHLRCAFEQAKSELINPSTVEK